MLWQATIPSMAYNGENYEGSGEFKTRQEYTQECEKYIPTGEWENDLVAVAKMQIGYQDNEENVCNKWNTLLVSESLYYAGIPESVFPTETNIEEWIAKLQEEQLYISNFDASITMLPEKGEMVILQIEDESGNQEKEIAIVEDVQEREGEYYVQTIEGEKEHNTYSVKEKEHKAFGEEVLGYALLSKSDSTSENEQSADEETQVALQENEFGKETVNGEGNSETNNINERLVVNFEAQTNGGNAQAGETQYVKVVSNYSQANHQEKNAEVFIKVGELPEGVTITGFTTDGKKEVVWRDDNNKEHNVTLHLIEENGIYYISFEQPAGATIEFSIQFNSENGIMGEKETLSLEVDKEKMQKLEGPGNDMFGEPVVLTWTASNEWNPVQKWVNNAKNNQILVNNKNKLVGELTYTVEAESQNKENFGEIWTDYVNVTDTLTLPEGITFPQGSKVDDSGEAIVDKNGNKIFYFSANQKQQINIKSLKLENNNKVVYEIQVPNTNRNSENVLTAEMEHISLEMKMNASLLELKEGYKDKSIQEMAHDKIENEVKMTPVPYKGSEGTVTSDKVTTTPTPVPEEFIVEKSANREHVQAGDAIQYTLSITNTGENAIKVKDNQGNYYTVTDQLVKYLTMTDEQIRNLPQRVSYDKNSNTISWVPDETELQPGKTYEISFWVTVRNATDEEMQELKNGSVIRNTAQYKEHYSNEVEITYDKAEIKVKKEGKDSNGDGKVSNSEKIIYTLTVKNDTNFDAVMDEMVKDTLPDGVEFDAVIDKENRQISQAGTYVAISNLLPNGHEVTFAKDGQNLSWNIGMLKAHEEIRLVYVCTVNTDKITSRSVIRNEVTTSDSGDAEESEVDYPIKVDKEVAQDTSIVYPDGTVFDYTVTMKNDEKNPSQKEDLELVDEMPAGMLPYGYDLIQRKDDGTTRKVSWKDFSEGKIETWNSTFSTEIDGRQTQVKRNWDGGIILVWKIGKLGKGEEVKITYQAQISIPEGEEGKKEFTNTVYVDGISKSVTVYGGEPKGEIYIEKHFDGEILYNIDGLTEEQKNITFTLIGKDNDGNEIRQSVKLGEFNNARRNGRWHHVFENLSPGTYTLIEENATIPGKVLTTTYKVNGTFAPNCVTDSTDKSGVIVEVDGQKDAEVIINNNYGSGSGVDLQKSVWAIKQGKITGNSSDRYEEWSNWYDKELFPIDDSDITNYVIYNMTVINTGSETVHVDTVEDELPEGLEYIGMKADYYGNEKRNMKEQFTTQIFTDAWSGLNLYDGHKLAQGISVTSKQEGKKVTFSFEKDSGGYELSGGQAITFLVLCRIKPDVKEGELITNAAKLLVDRSVQYKDCEEIYTQNTPYDLIQNNGKSKDEGIINGKRIISSSVTIIPENLPVPGIEKEAVSYIIPGKIEEQPLEENSNIQPESMVHWEITLHNDGTKDLKNYQVEDLVTEGFHLLTKAEANEKKIKSPYELTIFDYSGKKLNTYDVSSEVWKTIKNDSEENAFTFDFSEEKYSIPPGGYAKLRVYTNNLVTNYQVYKNTATILPSEKFDANRAKYGDLKKNDKGEYIGVTASAEVNALGDYASVSWKSVTEKGNEANTTKGTQKKNYISVGLDDDGNANMVTYTDNIRNISGKTFKQFTIVDLMPMRNDTGVINQEDKRGSEFSIAYSGGLNIYVISSGGVQRTVNEKDYKIEFSTKTSYTQEDFQGDSTQWHKAWEKGDCSFRVKMSEAFELAPNETLVIQYDGKIAEGARAGDIAWNSFGYQYHSNGCTTLLKAEPPKVGVMIPKVPVVKKEVVDSDGNIQEYDENKKFTFELYQKGEHSNIKLCEFTICQGGYVELSNLKDKDGKLVVLKDGTEYTIKEKVPEGYKLLGIGQEGEKLSTFGEEYTFTYYKEKDISILARNESLFRQEIPKTGGMGTNVYTVGGVLLMVVASLLYGYRLKYRKKKNYSEKRYQIYNLLKRRKRMKKKKNLLATLAVFVMVLAMGMTTFAADITISGGAQGSEYAAYKLLNVTDGGEGKFAYTINAKYESALKEVTGKTQEREIIDYISSFDAAQTRQFADAMYGKVKDLEADYTTANDKFTGVEQGYYLIVETKTGNDADAYSLVMLDTAGNDEVNVTTKEDKPELVKKVKEKNDSTGEVTDWQDGADYDIGDKVPFQLTGTVEAKYDNYETYYYAFHDTLSKGLTFNNDVKVYVDGTEISDGYRVVTDAAELENGETFKVVFDNLKVTPAHAGSKIVVEYTATLNEDAVIGDEGNPNTAKLEYSNNPYGDGTGETPEDKVTVFTYKLVANKVDKDGKALEGAGFTLYKYDAKKADYVAVKDEITGVTQFTFAGLDAGQYKLVETTVPAGYNKADDFEFTIKAEYDTNSNDPKLKKLVVVDKDGKEITEITINLAEGTASTNIVNLSGTELPSTGGIGTKIFYTVGAVLMIGAAVILISRKRTAQEK